VSYTIWDEVQRMTDRSIRDIQAKEDARVAETIKVIGQDRSEIDRILREWNEEELEKTLRLILVAQGKEYEPPQIRMAREVANIVADYEGVHRPKRRLFEWDSMGGTGSLGDVGPTGPSGPQTPEVIPSGKIPYENECLKPGRNDPCPCGSGKKAKKCCGKKIPKPGKAPWTLFGG
jgi:hypothetical protein